MTDVQSPNIISCNVEQSKAITELQVSIDLHLKAIDASIESGSNNIGVELGRIATEVSVLSSSGDYTAVSIAIVGALTAAVAAFLLNFFHWRLTKKRDSFHGQLLELLGLIRNVEEMAVKYWLSSYSVLGSLESKSLEIRLKSALTISASECEGFKRGFLLPNKKAKINLVYRHIMTLYDLVTGGDFESQSKDKDPVLAARISAGCNKARSEISALVLIV